MRVIIVEPMETPRVAEIGESLKEMQTVVGGLIQPIYLEDEVAAICNEEGKIRGMELNRALRDDDGRMFDIIAGTFFICGAPTDSETFASLTDDQMQRYITRFAKPEIFI